MFTLIYSRNIRGYAICLKVLICCKAEEYFVLNKVDGCISNQEINNGKHVLLCAGFFTTTLHRSYSIQLCFT